MGTTRPAWGRTFATYWLAGERCGARSTWSDACSSVLGVKRSKSADQSPSWAVPPPVSFDVQAEEVGMMQVTAGGRWTTMPAHNGVTVEQANLNSLAHFRARLYSTSAVASISISRSGKARRATPSRVLVGRQPASSRRSAMRCHAPSRPSNRWCSSSAGLRATGWPPPAPSNQVGGSAEGAVVPARRHVDHVSAPRSRVTSCRQAGARREPLQHGPLAARAPR